MKIRLKMVLGCLVALSSHLSLAGTPAPSYYYQQDVQNIQRPAPMPGVILPGPGLSPIGVWCEDRLFILRAARAEASRWVYRQDHPRAVATLINGLVEAANEGYQTNPPFTQTLIVRGVTLGRSLNAHVSTQLNGAKAVTLFLENYYDLIEEMATRIDVPYFTPGSCGYCNHARTEEFETALIEMAQKQISIVNTALLYNQGQVLVPVGPSALYLKTLEMMSYFASYDLRSSVYANGYACQIRELGMMHAKLRSFNSYTQSEWANREMIVAIYPHAQSVIEALSYHHTCQH